MSTERNTSGENRPLGGGGPLRAIADDPDRSAGARDLSEAFIRLFKQRQDLHARRIEFDSGTTVSFAQIRMLFHLPPHQALSLTSFSQAAGMTPAAATQALGPLERMNLVSRHRSRSDRRAVRIALTPTGQALLADLRTKFVGHWNELEQEFSDTDLRTAAAVLVRTLTVFDPTNW